MPTAFREACPESTDQDHHWVYDAKQQNIEPHAFYCTKCNRFLLAHRPIDVVPNCCPNALKTVPKM